MDKPVGPTDSVLKRIEGFARSSHDSGYEQGYVDAYREVRKALTRRSLMYLLAGLALGSVICVLAFQRGLLGQAFVRAPDPRDLGSERGTRYIAAANFAKDYTVSIQSRTPAAWLSEETIGTGSGFLFDDKGHIVTNSHVVKMGRVFWVTWRDRYYEAELVGKIEKADIAVLRFGAAGIKGATFAAEGEMPGLAEEVLAVGSPFGLSQTVTQGIVSYVGRRTDDSGIPYIQTDCPINRGNSGGPLVNLEGRVVGMNRLIYSESGGSAGIGFAIPIDVVRKAAEAIIRKAAEEGPVTAPKAGDEGIDFGQAWMGIMPDPEARVRVGVAVGFLMPDGPAAVAGLAMGDVIVGVNQNPVGTLDELRAEIARYRPGEKVRVRFLRDGAEQAVELTLGLRGG